MCKSCVGDIFGIEAFYRSELTRGAFIASSAAAAGLAAAGFSPKAIAAPTQPAIVFYGGPVVTMDDAFANAQAVAISGGTILAVGSKDQAIGAAGAGAQMVDLDGRTLMPGLIDPHQHPIPGGIMLTQMLNVGYDSYKQKTGVIEALKAKAAQISAGQWIYAAYYDNVLQGGDLTLAELDDVSTQHPIFVYYVSMHSATGN